MNVSFDGMRKNATRSMNQLHSAIQNVINNDISESDKKSLIEAFNESAMFVDSFNCLFDDNIEGDLTNLSHLNVNRFEMQ